MYLFHFIVENFPDWNQDCNNWGGGGEPGFFKVQMSVLFVPKTITLCLLAIYWIPISFLLSHSVLEILENYQDSAPIVLKVCGENPIHMNDPH